MKQRNKCGAIVRAAQRKPHSNHSLTSTPYICCYVCGVFPLCLFRACPVTQYLLAFTWRAPRFLVSTRHVLQYSICVYLFGVPFRLEYIHNFICIYISFNTLQICIYIYLYICSFCDVTMFV